MQLGAIHHSWRALGRAGTGEMEVATGIRHLLDLESPLGTSNSNKNTGEQKPIFTIHRTLRMGSDN